MTYYTLPHISPGKPCVISICLTLPQKPFKLTLTQAYLATWKTTVTKKSRLSLNVARKAATLQILWQKEIILPSENLCHLNLIHIPS